MTNEIKNVFNAIFGVVSDATFAAKHPVTAVNAYKGNYEVKVSGVVTLYNELKNKGVNVVIDDDQTKLTVTVGEDKIDLLFDLKEKSVTFKGGFLEFKANYDWEAIVKYFTEKDVKASDVFTLFDTIFGENSQNVKEVSKTASKVKNEDSVYTSDVDLNGCTSIFEPGAMDNIPDPTSPEIQAAIQQEQAMQNNQPQYTDDGMIIPATIYEQSEEVQDHGKGNNVFDQSKKNSAYDDAEFFWY